MNKTNEEDYDVVSEVLQKHADRLEQMDIQHIDQHNAWYSPSYKTYAHKIRLEHIRQLKQAIQMWNDRVMNA
ncbi:MAG: hypothetical protein WCH12_06355 [Candidatus Nitrotoga sp.]